MIQFDEEYDNVKVACLEKLRSSYGYPDKMIIFDVAFDAGFKLATDNLSNLSTTGKNWKDGERLQVATSILQGLLSSGQEKHPVKRAIELADALITECNK